MTTLILGKNARGEAIVLGTEKNDSAAHEFARATAITGKVSEVYCVPTSAAFLASEINRVNPDQDESLAEATPEDLGAGSKGLNETGIEKRRPVTNESARPEVNAAQAQGKEAAPKDAVKKA